jgi:hypothetical protein
MLLKDENVLCHKLEVSPDGRWLVTVRHDSANTADHDWYFWDTRTGEKLPNSNTDSSASRALCFSPAGPLGVVLACSDEIDRRSCLRLYGVPSLKPVLAIPNASGPIAFSGDGRFMVVRNSTPTNCDAHVYAVATGKLVASVDPRPLDNDPWHRPFASGFALSPSGDRLLIFTRYRVFGPSYVPEAIHIAELPGGNILAEWANVQHIGVANQSRSVVFGEIGLPLPQGPISVVDFETGTVRRRMEVSLENERFHPGSDPYRATTGGRWLAIQRPEDSFQQRLMNWLAGRFPNRIPLNASPNTAVGIYDTESGACQCKIPVSSGWCPFLLSSNGQMFAVRRDDGVVDIFELPPRKPLTWFVLAAAVLALPFAGLAWRRSRRLRREVA